MIWWYHHEKKLHKIHSFGNSNHNLAILGSKSNLGIKLVLNFHFLKNPTWWKFFSGFSKALRLKYVWIMLPRCPPIFHENFSSQFLHFFSTRGQKFKSLGFKSSFLALSSNFWVQSWKFKCPGFKSSEVSFSMYH